MAASVIASLAVWDPLLAERLARQRLDVVFQPDKLLQAIAIERRWEGQEASWHSGSMANVDGREVIHSAFLACNGPKDHLHRRVWSGQVGVLLPFVEERRQDLLMQLAGVLQVPYTTRFGIVEDVRDLEIGHIESQLLTASPRGRSELVEFVRKLREIRNALAHQEAITAAQLMVPALADWMDPAR